MAEAGYGLAPVHLTAPTPDRSYTGSASSVDEAEGWCLRLIGTRLDSQPPVKLSVIPCRVCPFPFLLYATTPVHPNLPHMCPHCTITRPPYVLSSFSRQRNSSLCSPSILHSPRKIYRREAYSILQQHYFGTSSARFGRKHSSLDKGRRSDEDV